MPDDKPPENRRKVQKMVSNQKIDVHLICNAKFHDTNFSRLELLKLLAELEDVCVTVNDSYTNKKAISNSKMLITYTCDLAPNAEEQAVLRRYLEMGGRWFALHGTNAMVELVDGVARAPDNAPELMQCLGSRFVSHPAIEKFIVRVADKTHPLTEGLDDFEIEDEPYYCEFYGDNHVLLDATYHSPSTAYEQPDFGIDRTSQPQMYLHKIGRGEVLYLTLGHCSGKYDRLHAQDVSPVVRCAWNYPIFYELLRRGIRWGTQRTLDSAR